MCRLCLSLASAPAISALVRVPVALALIAALFHGDVVNRAPVRPAVGGRGQIGLGGFLSFELGRLDASPVAQTLLKYLENNPEGMEEVPAHDFFVTLGDLHTNNGQSRPNKNWPGTVEGFGKDLVRIKSVMRRVGWNLDSKRHKTGMRWKITPLDQDAGSDDANLHQIPKTYTNLSEPTPQPTPHNALNEDKLSENSAFGVGDVGFSTNPKYVPHSTQNGTESMCVIPSSTYVLDIGKNPTSPTPQPPLSGDDITTEYF